MGVGEIGVKLRNPTFRRRVDPLQDRLRSIGSGRGGGHSRLIDDRGGGSYAGNAANPLFHGGRIGEPPGEREDDDFGVGADQLFTDLPAVSREQAHRDHQR